MIYCKTQWLSGLYAADKSTFTALLNFAGVGVESGTKRFQFLKILTIKPFESIIKYKNEQSEILITRKLVLFVFYI